VIEVPSDRLRNDLGDTLGVFVVPQKVRHDPRRSGDGKPIVDGPFSLPQRSYMEPYVRTSGLPPPRNGELVLVGGQMP
jgi:hypothetical protein